MRNNLRIISGEVYHTDNIPVEVKPVNKFIEKFKALSGLDDVKDIVINGHSVDDISIILPYCMVNVGNMPPRIKTICELILRGTSIPTYYYYLDTLPIKTIEKLIEHGFFKDTNLVYTEREDIIKCLALSKTLRESTEVVFSRVEKENDIVDYTELELLDSIKQGWGLL